MREPDGFGELVTANSAPCCARPGWSPVNGPPPRISCRALWPLPGRGGRPEGCGYRVSTRYRRVQCRVITGYFSMTRSGGTVWLDSDKLLGCADPTTGRIRAGSVQPRDLIVGTVVTTRDQVLSGAWKRHSPDSYVLALHPPAICR